MGDVLGDIPALLACHPEMCIRHGSRMRSRSQASLPAQGSAGTLDAVLEALLRGASTHIEPQTRKTCVQVWRPTQMMMHNVLYVETCAVSAKGLSVNSGSVLMRLYLR